MHVIEETDTFTLVGVDAKLGKLTLFDAEGPRERGSIEHIALRVGDLDAAVAAAARKRRRSAADGGLARFEGPGGVPLALIAARRGRVRPRPRAAAAARSRRARWRSSRGWASSDATAVWR